MRVTTLFHALHLCLLKLVDCVQIYPVSDPAYFTRALNKKHTVAAFGAPCVLAFSRGCKPDGVVRVDGEAGAPNLPVFRLHHGKNRVSVK